MHPSVPPSYEFRKERERTWHELAGIVRRAESSSIRKLTSRDLSRLPLLYRQTLSSLAALRGMSVSKVQLEYLEDLCGRAYAILNTTRPRIRSAIAAFVAQKFPRVVRQLAVHLALATAIFLAGTATGFFVTQADPDKFYNFVPESYAQGRGPEASTEDLRAVLYHGGMEGDDLAAFSSHLLSNNAKVGMLCFALGIALGIPVIYLLFTNGLILGAFAALYHGRGLSLDFWGWILPHGVTEILAVLLSGAAGLAIAQHIIFPGKLTRLKNLARFGPAAGTMVLGAVLLFALAALIEGFFRQLVQDTAIRYLVVLTTTLIWCTYFFAIGRGEPPPEEEPLDAF